MSSTEIDYTVINPKNKWKLLAIQWRYSLWALWTSIGSMMLGLDYVAGGQLAALPKFKEQFGTIQPDGSYIVPARYLSAWASIGPACDIVAALLAVPFLERYGRKPQILVAAIISIVGVLLQQLATEWKMHLAGRAVNGAAIGIMFTISPLWIGETCRPELRGFFLCFFNTSIVIGQFAIVIISYISNSIETRWQWWTPVISMYIFPLFLTTVYPWFPESPSWLLRKGRYADARKALRRMYGIDDTAFYDIEMSRLEAESLCMTTVRGDASGRSINILGMFRINMIDLECFRGTNLKRTVTAIFAASGQQMIGATFVTGYATYFLQLINIDNFFLASCILYVVMVLSTCAVFPLVEVVGRRTLIVPSLFVLCLLLLVIGIMGCIPNQTVGGWVIVACIYVWAIIYQLSIGATGFVLASEVSTVRLRGVTQAFVTVTNAVWGLIMQFTIPYMINTDAGNLGGKTGFIFFATGMITAVVGFFLFPETKGISFDVLDELYDKGVPPRHFKERAKELLRSDHRGDKIDFPEVRKIHPATPRDSKDGKRICGKTTAA